MSIAVAILSLMIVLLSVYGSFNASNFVAVISRFMASRSGLWLAVIARLVLAIALWFSAPVSQTPTIFAVLAVLVLIGAFALPVMGSQRIARLMAWFANQPTSAIRLWCLVGAAFGGFLLWSILPALTAAQ